MNLHLKWCKDKNRKKRRKVFYLAKFHLAWQGWQGFHRSLSVRLPVVNLPPDAHTQSEGCLHLIPASCQENSSIWLTNTIIVSTTKHNNWVAAYSFTDASRNWRFSTLLSMVLLVILTLIESMHTLSEAKFNFSFITK